MSEEETISVLPRVNLPMDYTVLGKSSGGSVLDKGERPSEFATRSSRLPCDSNKGGNAREHNGTERNDTAAGGHNISALVNGMERYGTQRLCFVDRRPCALRVDHCQALRYLRTTTVGFKSAHLPHTQTAYAPVARLNGLIATLYP